MNGTIEHSFWDKVNKEGKNNCWIWTACCTPQGYGQYRIPGNPSSNSMAYSHRFIYEKIKGSIPEGLQIDHLCRVRHCVNPDHLEAVTSRENTLRGNSFSALNAKKIHCPQGHPYSGSNLYTTPAGDRRCRTCGRNQARAYKKRLRQMAT